MGRVALPVCLAAAVALSLVSTTSARAAPLPSAPACPTAVAFAVDGRTTSPSPLPPATSTVGGPSLGARGLQVRSSPGTRPPPAVRAAAWMVTDLVTGEVLAACNAHVPLAPASTLKVLTALALHPVIAPTTVYTATAADVAVDGTKVGLVPGSRYTVDNLWHGLLLSSGNDTANALASLAGGTATATALMAATARRLGAEDTHAVNTSGLDAPGQVSSAYDLAVFGRAALADPALSALMRVRSYAFPAVGTTLRGGTRTAFQIQNHNGLLFNVPGATGVKNGYTTTAGGAYIGSATRGARSYLVTVLDADTGSWHIARDLLEWAFAAGAGTQAVGTLVDGAAPSASPTTPDAVPTPSIGAPPTGDPGARAAAGIGPTGAAKAIQSFGSPRPAVSLIAGAVLLVAALAGLRLFPSLRAQRLRRDSARLPDDA